MFIITSCLAFLLGLFPIRKYLRFRPRYYTISVLLYCLIDFLIGALATSIAAMIAGSIASYFAAILVVIASMLSLQQGEGSIFVAAGTILVLSPSLMVIGMCAFLLSFLTTRYTVLSTYFTVIAIVLFGVILTAHIALSLVILCLGILMFIDQRGNFQKYRRGLDKPIKW